MFGRASENDPIIIPDESLVVEQKSINVNGKDNTVTIKVTSSSTYSVTSTSKWIVSNSSTGNGNLDIQISANSSYMPRSGEVTLKLGKLSETVKITQEGKYVFVNADKTGMDSDAKVLTSKLNVGWNLGNTLESFYD